MEEKVRPVLGKSIRILLRVVIYICPEEKNEALGL
jgi:hypothetical protein